MLKTRAASIGRRAFSRISKLATSKPRHPSCRNNATSLKPEEQRSLSSWFRQQSHKDPYSIWRTLGVLSLAVVPLGAVAFLEERVEAPSETIVVEVSDIPSPPQQLASDTSHHSESDSSSPPPPPPPPAPPAISDDEALQELAKVKKRIDFLQRELEEIARLQTVRLYEALKLQKAEDAQVAHLAVARQAQEFQDQVEHIRKEIDELVAVRLDKEKHELTATALKEREQALLKQKRRLEQEAAEELSKVKSEAEKRRQGDLLRQSKERTSTIDTLAAELKALDKAFSNDSNYRAASHTVRHISTAALSLVHSLDQPRPFADEFHVLRTAAVNDTLIASALETIPRGAIESGVPTIMQLQDRFHIVSSEGRKAALVPPNSGLWGYLLASFIYALRINERGFLEGDNVDARFARAEWHLSRGDLAGAVSEMDQLHGLPAGVAHDWLQSAKNRLVTEQALQIVRSEASLLSLSLT